MVNAFVRNSVVLAVVAAIALILPSSTVAQEVGVKAGLNFASLTPLEDEDPEISRLLGAVAGLWVRIAPARRVSLQVEGLFSEKGVTYEPNDFGLDNAADIRVRYIEIPVLARADFGASGSAARAFVVGGVAPAFKVSAHTKTVFNGQEQTRDIDDEIYAGDVGLVGGFGVAFGRTLVEARYTHGVRHINTDDNGDEDRVKNRVFSVMVGFRLR